MKPRTQLTIKQRKFVKEYVSNGGNGTQAVLNSYDTTDYMSAAALASGPLLNNAKVVSSIEAALQQAGLNDTTISENLASIARSSPEKPLSASEIIKANELALKLLGRLNKTSVKTTVSLSQRLGDQPFSELKEKLASTQSKSSSLLEDLD